MNNPILGKGVYGEVYALSNSIAVKTVPSVFNENTQKTEIHPSFIIETSILKKTNHPNIIRILDASIDHIKETFSFTMPLSTIGTVLDNLKSINKREISIGIARGIQYLLDMNIFHGDLKLDNVLLFPDVNVGLKPVLIDFGVSQVNICERELHDDSHIFWNKAPEQLLEGPYNHKAQSWALGMMILGMYEKSKFKGKSLLEQLCLIFKQFGTPDVDDPWINKLPEWTRMKNNVPKWKASTTQLTDNRELNDILAQLLKLNSAERISVRDALKHPFFGSLHFPSITCEEKLRNNTMLVEPCLYQRKEFLDRLPRQFCDDMQVFFSMCQFFDRFYAVRKDIDIGVFIGLAIELIMAIYGLDEDYSCLGFLDGLDASTIMKLQGEILTVLDYNIYFTTIYDWIKLFERWDIGDTLREEILHMMELNSNDPEELVRNLL